MLIIFRKVVYIMINTILRKTLYKEFDYQTQNTLLYVSKQEIILNFTCNFLCFLFLCTLPIIVIIVFPYLFTDLKIQLLYLLLIIIYTILVCLIFREKNFCQNNYVSRTLHYYFYTKKGKAISKEAFKTIKKKNELLYSTIKDQDCRGLCYSVCFELLKTLKKGGIQFISVNEFTSKKETPFETIHVIYVNNNYVFDTYCHRQLPLEAFLAIHQAKIYKTFKYEDIKDFSYEEFRKIEYPDFAKWCKENDVHELWNCT